MVLKALHRLVARRYLRKPDQEGLLSVKFPTASSLAHASLNEIAYRLGLRRSYRLTSVNLELTNRCNLRCSMCPVNRDMVREKGFMDPALFRRIIDENPQLEHVLAFQWGEPLMHPHFFELVRYATDRGVRVMITSNGTYLSPELRQRLLASGLDRITFSVDGVGEIHTHIRGYEYERLKKDVLSLRDERDRAGLDHPRIDVSMVVFEETEPYVGSFFAEWGGLVDRVQAIPKFVSGPRTVPCRELWRGTAVVLWDGRVSICCRDADGEAIVGDAGKEPLEAIWNGRRMQELRRSHLQRDFRGICRDCSEYSSETVSPRFG